MPHLCRISTYPIKALDPFEQPSGVITEGGTIDHDREYAILAKPAEEPYDPATESAAGGAYINGKRTAAVHRLRSTFDPAARTLTLRVQGEAESRTFDLDDRTELNAWLSDFFGERASVRRYQSAGHHDMHKHGISGPSVISTGTIREVAAWFPDLEVEDIRRRFRANLEIDGCPPFWEDRLVADRGEAVSFRIGAVRLLGVEPCKRCVVISRDPDTGKEHPGFRERFVRRRRETLPDWVDSDRFDTALRLMTITAIPESEWGKRIHVGDAVERLGTVDHPT